VRKNKTLPRAGLDFPNYRPLDRGRASDQILDDLRDQILRGALVRGDKLPTERELAELYGVSDTTIREAVRGLTAMRLIEVRHGSGAYVTADGNQIVAMSLQSFIQIEKVGAAEVMGIMGVLNAYATELAVSNATESDIVVLNEALKQLANASGVDQMAQSLKKFLHALATASHNPLLIALCNVLANLQIELALAASGRSFDPNALSNERKNLVKAIEKRDRESARQCVTVYHSRASEMIAALPKAGSLRSSDPKFAELLSSLIRRNPSISGDHPRARKTLTEKKGTDAER